MNSIISDNLTALAGLCKKYSVGRLYLFGSVTGNSFNDRSDIDFLVSFDDKLSIEDYSDNYFALHYALQQLLKREIDLITEKSLSNPYFIKSVEATKQLIYAA